jgi:hypothetical protein
MLLFVCVITGLSWSYTEKNSKSAGIAVVPMLFLFFAAYDIAYAPLFVAYPVEILPFELRAKGVAVTFMVDAVACFCNQYANPVGFAAMNWKFYFVYVGLLVCFLVAIYLLFPETKGRSLEKTSEIFDKPENKPHVSRLSKRAAKSRMEGAYI